jgi:hypothetical protein
MIGQPYEIVSCKKIIIPKTEPERHDDRDEDKYKVDQVAG